MPSIRLPENPSFNSKKRSVQPGDAFEDAVLMSGFEIVKF
jgi:hypothetical protein